MTVKFTIIKTELS